MEVVMRLAAWMMIVLCAACDKSEKPAGGEAPQAATKSEAKGTTEGKAAATKEVSLDPLPLTVTLPAGESGTTMDKSMGGRKSVGVSYEAILSGINVSEPSEKGFDEVKARVKKDVIYPFKRWAKETPTSGISEFSEEGKGGYLAWSWKVVGGKPYLCQSTGMSGLKNVEDADKVLALCDTLKAK